MIRVEKDGDGRPGQNQGPVPLHYRTNHSQTERGFLNYYVDRDEKNLHKWVNKQHANIYYCCSSYSKCEVIPDVRVSSKLVRVDVFKRASSSTKLTICIAWLAVHP